MLKLRVRRRAGGLFGMERMWAGTDESAEGDVLSKPSSRAMPGGVCAHGECGTASASAMAKQARHSGVTKDRKPQRRRERNKETERK